MKRKCVQCGMRATKRIDLRKDVMFVCDRHSEWMEKIHIAKARPIIPVRGVD